MPVRYVNDATASKIGDVFQYMVALEECFELKDGEELVIEECGDVSRRDSKSQKLILQIEVKHHLANKALTDKSEDFWKTLDNWLYEFDRIKTCERLVFLTTSDYGKNTLFKRWDVMDKEERFNRLKKVYSDSKDSKAKGHYDNVFSHDKEDIVSVLERIIIIKHNKINECYKGFERFLGFLPKERREDFILNLLGKIFENVTKPPHKWVITKDQFDVILQDAAPRYVKNSYVLPDKYSTATIPLTDKLGFTNMKFVTSLRNIGSEDEVPEAMNDYWRTNMTNMVIRKQSPYRYVDVENYRDDLHNRLDKRRKRCLLESRSCLGNKDECDIKSRMMYLEVMEWPATNFGLFACNHQFYQHGIIHNIVQDSDFRWEIY